MMNHNFQSYSQQSWKYVIYLTSWGICTITFAVTVETILTLYIYIMVSRADKPSDALNRMLHISWGISHATYSAALFISILFWSLLFNWGEEKLSWINFFVHGSQGIYSLLDQFISARPWDGGHWWISLPLPIVYLTFNLIYYAAGGTDKLGNDFIYPVLDWSGDPGYAIGLSVGAVFIMLAVHYFFVFLTWLRDRIHSR
eukprot:TRINITY_DN11922_c0_g1_i2.p1 TRINITY_DN11922_c0_g1~~TRINITY_DN11922_c0_g1_i2.p1  ORF type:complete len:200 (-),score=30.77 TRINITY_DN11922_c0_g1_i2:54-653(-)